MTATPCPGRQLQQLPPPPSWKRTVRCASGQMRWEDKPRVMVGDRGRLTPIALIDYAADDKFCLDVFSCKSWLVMIVSQAVEGEKKL